MNAKHTPGPWAARSYDKYGSWQIIQADNQTAHNICDNVRGMGSECEANARLIAAAPDLLAACEEAREWVRVLALRFGPDEPASKRGCVAFEAQLAAAISKARQS